MIISQRFQSIWMEFDVLLSLFSLINPIVILSRPFNIQGRENRTYVILLTQTNKQTKEQTNKQINIGCIQTFIDQFLSDLLWWYTSLCSTFDINLDDPDSYLRWQLF